MTAFKNELKRRTDLLDTEIIKLSSEMISFNSNLKDVSDYIQELRLQYEVIVGISEIERNIKILSSCIEVINKNLESIKP